MLFKLVFFFGCGTAVWTNSVEWPIYIFNFLYFNWILTIITVWIRSEWFYQFCLYVLFIWCNHKYGCVNKSAEAKWSSKRGFGRSLLIKSFQSSLWAYISSTHCTVPASILHLPISSSVSVILPISSTSTGGWTLHSSRASGSSLH